jgi:exosortase/archaeosortase family protein
MLIYQLGAQWSAYEQYRYGWAVPFLCAYLVWQRLQNPETRDQKTETGPPPALGSKLSTFPRFSFQLSALALLALLWLLARWLHEANPIWRLTSWVLALVIIALTLLTAYALGDSRRETGDGNRPLPASRFPLRQIAFPLIFFLVAVPWPTGLENLMTQSFMQANVSVTTELLTLLGIPALQKGNVIEIATGLVGVDEACSGIRSFQATLMIGLFLGDLYALSVLRRALLGLSGFALAFVFNIGRTLLLVYVASRDGIGAVAKWHDPAGITILVACFIGLWLVAHAFRKAASKRQNMESRKQKPGHRPEECGAEISAFSFRSSTLKIAPLALFLAAWFIFTEGAVEWWYRAHEQSASDHANWSLKLGDANSGYTRIKIAPNILGQFGADESTQAQWRDRGGHAWQLFYFRWLPTQSLQRRVAVQFAKTHGPTTCLPAVGMNLKSDLGVFRLRVRDLALALQHYEFTAEGRSIHVFYAIYEDATGGAVLANRRQDSATRVAAAVAGSRNYGQRFLEIAVSGYDDRDGARAGVAEQLAKIISQEK